MKINTQFTVAIHILALIELNRIRFGDGSINTSENLSRSVNTNPVVIRRILSQLKEAGFVEIKAGVGGACLKRRPDLITLLEIYKSVRKEEDTVFDIHKTSNPRCYVGSSIYDAIYPLLNEAENAFEEKLKTFTLADVIEPIAKKNDMNLH